jgi:hypothetical protein
LGSAGAAATKKLKAVAAALLGAPGGGDEAPSMSHQAAADLKAFGVPPEEIAKLGLAVDAPPQKRIVEVEPENADAVRVFLRMQSQWKQQSVGYGRAHITVPTGLDYSALPVVAQALGVTVTADLLDRLGVMEAESVRIVQRRYRAP